MLGKAACPVTDVNVDAPAVARVDEPRVGLGRELGDPLDRVHLGRQLCQHRRLVAGAGADVEHALVPPQGELGADAGDHVRL